KRERFGTWRQVIFGLASLRQRCDFLDALRATSHSDVSCQERRRTRCPRSVCLDCPRRRADGYSRILVSLQLDRSQETGDLSPYSLDARAWRRRRLLYFWNPA